MINHRKLVKHMVNGNQTSGDTKGRGVLRGDSTYVVSDLQGCAQRLGLRGLIFDALQNRPQMVYCWILFSFRRLYDVYPTGTRPESLIICHKTR